MGKKAGISFTINIRFVPRGFKFQVENKLRREVAIWLTAKVITAISESFESEIQFHQFLVENFRGEGQ